MYTPKRGERYESMIWRTESGEALPHVITRVAKGAVYYRPDYGLRHDGSRHLGSVSYFPIEQCSRYLGRKLEGEK